VCCLASSLDKSIPGWLGRLFQREHDRVGEVQILVGLRTGYVAPVWCQVAVRCQVAERCDPFDCRDGGR
jgi:hypothetical protein